MIKALKGIGPKSANGLFLELKDKVGKMSGDVDFDVTQTIQ